MCGGGATRNDTRRKSETKFLSDWFPTAEAKAETVEHGEAENIVIFRPAVAKNNPLGMRRPS